MTVSVAQYEAAAKKLTSGVNQIQPKLDGFVAATNSTLGKWYIPDPVKEMVKGLAEKLISIAESIWNKIVELMKGIAAPVYMFEYAWKWESVKGTASGVASDVSPEVVGIPDWKGQTGTAYTNAIGPQSAAAAQISTISDKTAIALGLCATAGAAFYIALAIIVGAFLVQLVIAIAAVGSIIFSWAGLAMVVEDSAVSTGMIIAAVSALGVLLTAQATQMVALHGDAVDQTSFPFGKWPKATNLGN